MTKLFGTRSERELKKIAPLVDKIEALADGYKRLTDEELKAKTPEFRQRLENGETLDDLLPEAFAAVREASDRVLGMRHFRVQLMGGIVLHQGRIAEMKTGEGKTLVATLPAYLNALTGRGVHIVTVNDYLAKRDSEWMGKVYRFMGLSVGLIIHDMDNEARRQAYASDITYGTNNEMGFDYLRDNMAIYKTQMVQRGHVFAIVDEVDSILIDEARTPLIISGKGDESTDLYRQADDFVRTLRKKVYATTDEKVDLSEEQDADYIVDEKSKTSTLTASGIAKAERYFALENYADIENATLTHHINQALKAHGTMKRDVDYVIKDGEIIIVDEFTGRLMFGRRYSDGLHQAIEAKEHVDVQRENKTLATITFQNYFRMYEKLSGMTGTALTEEEEFGAIYRLDIIEVPTNMPLARVDKPDCVYKNDTGKNRAVIRRIKEAHAKGQPVLVGTISIEKSEYLSTLLRREGVAHNVLNAKQHEKEAEIIAQAGRLGAVTISTNMAGRGTDIMLGGNAEYMAKNDLRKAGYEDEVIAEATGYAETEDETILAARALYAEKLAEHKKVTAEEADAVRAAGGLLVLGTERHESRRIDNQLRGRAGRQGDPGETQFYMAMTDDVMRLFGSERVMTMMESLGIDDDTPIDQKILSNAIENAQKRIESKNFQIRKNVLEYDDVMNKQRELMYSERMQVLNGEDVEPHIRQMIRDVVTSTVHDGFGGKPTLESRAELEEIAAPFVGAFLTKSDLAVSDAEAAAMTPESVIDLFLAKADAAYDAKVLELGVMDGTDIPLMREIERVILLRVVDEYWMDQIDAMADLRQTVSLRAYGQVNPVDEYKRLGYDMFEAMINGIKEEVVRRIYTVRVRRENPLERRSVSRTVSTAAPVAGDGTVKRQPVKKAKKPGRNDPCPCGKWKADGSRPLKYKECCGRNE